MLTPSVDLRRNTQCTSFHFLFIFLLVTCYLPYIFSRDVNVYMLILVELQCYDLHFAFRFLLNLLEEMTTEAKDHFHQKL